jgi:hypothetical protein
MDKESKKESKNTIVFEGKTTMENLKSKYNVCWCNNCNCDCLPIQNAQGATAGVSAGSRQVSANENCIGGGYDS